MTYDYECGACEASWTTDESIKSDPTKARICPSCKKRKGQRVIRGTGGFILKGRGWYADGYSKTQRG